MKPSAHKSAPDRRQSLRYPLAQAFPYELVGVTRSSAGQALAQNISRGGMGLILDHHLAPGTLLNLDIPPGRTLHILHAMQRMDGRWHAGGIFTEALVEEGQLARRFLPARPSVLLIEEDAEVRHVIEVCLQASGVGVWPVASGREGLAVVHPHAAALDLALIDMGMNGLDGPHTLAALKQLAPALTCWLMTAGNTVEVSGADRIWTKPLNFPELSQAIRQVAAPGAQGK